MTRIRTYFLATRPMFLPAVLLPVLLGAVCARRAGGALDPWLFLLSIAAGAFYHLGMNALNDYFDCLGGTDNINKTGLTPFTGGSRMIQTGAMTPRATVALSAALLAAGTGAGLYLAHASGPWLLAIGGVGLATGVFYSAPPVSLAARGLGEATVGLDFGPLAVIGSYYVQTGSVGLEPVLVSLPLGFLIAGLLYVNEFPDFEADCASGKKTLVVRLGIKKARWGVPLISASAYLGIAAFAWTGLIPVLSLAAVLPAYFAARASAGVMRRYDRPELLLPSIKSIVLAHFLTGVLLVVACAM